MNVFVVSIPNEEEREGNERILKWLSLQCQIQTLRYGGKGVEWGRSRGGGGGGGVSKKFFGLKIRGKAGPPEPLPWIRHWHTKFLCFYDILTLSVIYY